MKGDNCYTKTALQKISLAHLTHLKTRICSQESCADLDIHDIFTAVGNCIQPEIEGRSSNMENFDKFQD